MSEDQSKYFTEAERLRNLKIVRCFELLHEVQDSLKIIEKWKSPEFKKTHRGLFDLVRINIDDILMNKSLVEQALVICMLSNVQKLMGEFIVSDGQFFMRAYSKLYMCEGLLLELNNEFTILRGENYRFA